LSPSVRNYDRVMLPSQQQQQPSGAAKIRPGRRGRGGRLPSSEEVFTLGVQTPAAADDNSSPPPNGTVDQLPLGALSSQSYLYAKPAGSKTDNGGRGKASAKKDDNPQPARCLRGRPPQLETCYFVPDDESSAGPSRRQKTAKNDPFWEASEAPSSPRRPSIINSQSINFFKPTGSSENLASTSGGVGANSTPDSAEW